MVGHMVEDAIADADVARLIADDFARGEHAPIGVEQVIVGRSLQDLAAFLQAGFELSEEFGTGVPILRLPTSFWGVPVSGQPKALF